MSDEKRPMAGLLTEPLPEDVPGRWWVAHTRPRAEKALSAELARLAILHYLPLHERKTRSRNTHRISRSVVPVFTGYLFFAATEEQRSAALKTHRIVNVLTVPNQRQLVSELRHIQKVLATDTAFGRDPRIRVGHWVRIIAGPLLGVEGVISRFRSQLRVFLNVNTLGQSINVETAADLVEPIDPPPYADDWLPARRRPKRPGPKSFIR